MLKLYAFQLLPVLIAVSVLGLNVTQALGKTPEEKKAASLEKDLNKIEKELVGYDRADVRVQLKEMGETLKRLEQATKDIYGEVERRKEVMQVAPGYISPFLMGDGGFITPMFPHAAEVMKNGDLLPPRQKWLGFFGQKMDQLIPILKEELSEVSLPNKNDPGVAVQWKVMMSAVKSVEDNVKQLDSLMKKPPYDNVEIAKLAVRLRSDIEGMDEIRKRVLKAVIRDQKHNIATGKASN